VPPTTHTRARAHTHTQTRRATVRADGCGIQKQHLEKPPCLDPAMDGYWVNTGAAVAAAVVTWADSAAPSMQSPILRVYQSWRSTGARARV
jgi:hypothetical protein